MVHEGLDFPLRREWAFPLAQARLAAKLPAVPNVRRLDDDSEERWTPKGQRSPKERSGSNCFPWRPGVLTVNAVFRLSLRRLLSALLLTLSVARAAEPGGAAEMSWLDNGTIRLGIDLGLGGSIVWLSKSGDGLNVINTHDWGREVQMSFYSGPIPFVAAGQQPAEAWSKLGWNPIQAGDFFGHRARVLAQHDDGRRLYVKCVPMQWPMNDVPGECIMESWLELDGATVRARARLLNARADHTLYPARAQELPAVYTNAPWHRLFTYSGAHPGSGEQAQELTPRPPPAWSRWTATENWSALLDDSGWGLGVWNGGTTEFLGGFNGKPGSGGTHDPACGYVSPVRAELLDHDIHYAYEYELTLGTLEQIRARALSHGAARALPEWSFTGGRQGWHYRHATDAGWRNADALHMHWEEGDPSLVSPPFFCRAEGAGTLVLEAAITTSDKTGQVFWTTTEQREASAQSSVNFPILGDGVLRTIRIRLSDSPAYHGGITSLRIDPGDAPGGAMTVRSIRLEK